MKHRCTLFLMAAVALFAPNICGSAQKTMIPIDGYAAIVNERIIMVSDVMASVAPLREKLETVYSGEELQRRMTRAYLDSLDNLVSRALIMAEFEANEGSIPDRVISDQMNEMIRDQFDNDRVRLLKELTEQQMTMDDWREQLREQLVVSMLRREHVLDKISVSPLDIRTRYEERLADYQQEEEIKLRMISLHKGETEEDALAKRTLARSIWERAIFGENFTALAREFSEGSKASRGGDWGWIKPGDLRDEIATVVADLEPGKISEIIATDDHFYLVVLEARKAAGVTPMEDVKEELTEELRREQFEKLFDDWMARLKEKHYVKVFEL